MKDADKKGSLKGGKLMEEYKIRVLFYTGFNHFWDKIVARVSVVAEDKEHALEKVRVLYPKATNEMVLNCGIECFVLGKWKEELKYEFIENDNSKWKCEYGRILQILDE